MLTRFILQEQRQHGCRSAAAAAAAAIQSSGWRRTSQHQQDAKKQQQIRWLAASDTNSRRPPPPRGGVGGDNDDSGFTIPAQLVVFTIIMLPALGFWAYHDIYGPSEEEREHEIRLRYSKEISEQAAKKQAMREVFQHAIFNPDGSMDKKLQGLLYAGKDGKSKERMHAVDEELYGTKKGVETREQAVAKLEQERFARKERIRKRLEAKKKRKKKATTTSDSGETEQSTLSQTISENKSVIAFVAVAVIAASQLVGKGGGKDR